MLRDNPIIRVELDKGCEYKHMRIILESELG